MCFSIFDRFISFKAHSQPDGSAAGQLRLMSAQQRTPQPPPPPQAAPPSSQVTEPQSSVYGQQRRTLGNIDNVGPGVRSGMVARDISPSVSPMQVPKSSARATLPSTTPNSSTTISQKPQFYAHNPGVRSKRLIIGYLFHLCVIVFLNVLFNFVVPPDKYFLGCAFYIVEYDRNPENNVTAWEEIIREHGGEVESIYTHR